MKLFVHLKKNLRKADGGGGPRPGWPPLDPPLSLAQNKDKEVFGLPGLGSSSIAEVYCLDELC
jgi:hypothetical protein